MTAPLTVPPCRGMRSFLDFPVATDLDALAAQRPHVAILGLPYGDPYSVDEVANDQTNAPTAIRRASDRVAFGLDR